MNSALRRLIVVLASAVLVACGGGGGGETGGGPPPDRGGGLGGLSNDGTGGSPGGGADGGTSDGGDGTVGPVTGDPARPWTWSTAEPSQAGWSRIHDLSLVPSAASNLPDGRILFWSAEQRLSFNDPGRTFTTIFDPASGTAAERLVAETSHDMFCPGTANLPDGRLLVSGGIDSGTVSIYDPADNSWSLAPPMNIPRGYHSNVLTADGNVLALGGSWSGPIGGKDGELFVPGSGWRRLPGVPIAPMVGPDPGGMYRADNHLWLFTTGDQRVFHAGPSANMHWIGTAGDGSVMAAGSRGDDAYSQNGSAAMYTVDRVLKTGGAPAYENASATTSSYTIALGTEATVRKVAPMAYPRAFHNSVVLPNGQVVVIGGQRYAVPFTDDQSVLVPELWDPATRTFTAMPPMAVPRNYHGVALLMNDGRVVVSGSGLCGTCATNHPNVQILTPPYLLAPGGGAADRPTITAAPAQAAFGSTIGVATNRAVATFVLMRLASTTHTVNNDQRRIPLSHASSSATTHTVTIPSNPGIAPPGDYMLFALDSAGVPSVSRRIRVSANGAPRITNPGPIASSLQTPVDLTITGTGGGLAWSATGLPPGLSMDGSGRITGAAAVTGSYRVTVTARTATAAASTDLHWTVTTLPAARFVRLEAFSEITGAQWASIAELEILDPAGQSMSTAGWTASADSNEPQNPAQLAIDGATASLWHSRYGGGILPMPHALVVDMKRSRTIGGFRYWPRQDGSNNGGIASFRFAISQDGNLWIPVASGDFTRWQTGAQAKTVLLENVAAGKPTSQSSGEPGSAARAVDGNPDGNFANGSVSTTAGQAAPWWQVDLRDVHSLQAIRLWNRTDCCAERLADLTVFVSRSDMSGRSMASLAADPAVWRHQVVGPAGRETLIRGNVHGRFVRVQAAGNATLSLAEVEVFGVADDAGTPTLDDPRDVIGPRGQAAVVALRGSDSTGRPLRYAATDLPDGLRIEPATGRIGGTPTRVGAWLVTVSARNDSGRAVQSTFTWIVTEPAVVAADLRPPFAALAAAPVANDPAGASASIKSAAGPMTPAMADSARATVITTGTAPATAAATAAASAAIAAAAPATATPATAASPGTASAAAIPRGQALFNGEAALAGRLAGHDRDLPAAVTRCAACHERPASSSSTVAAGAGQAAAVRAGGDRAGATFGPTLDVGSLTQARSRRGGPPSRYDAATFCSVLRTGVDPASMVLSQQMPRYDVDERDCAALWAWLDARG